MSWQATTAVSRHSKAKGSERLLMLIIANHVGPNGTAAFPSIKTLAEETLLSERAISYLLRKLEGKLKELKIGIKQGPNQSNLYTILLPGAMGGKDERVPRSDEKIAPPKQRTPARSDANIASGSDAVFALPEPPQVVQNPAGVVQNRVVSGATAIAPKQRNNQLNEEEDEDPRVCVREGESFLSSSSHKFSDPDVIAICDVCGLKPKSGLKEERWREVIAAVHDLRTSEMPQASQEEIAGEVRRRFAMGTWNLPKPPHPPQIASDWRRMGLILEQRALQNGHAPPSSSSDIERTNRELEKMRAKTVRVAAERQSAAA